MRHFLTWLLRPAINAILDERAGRAAGHRAFNSISPLGEPGTETLTYDEIMARKEEFLRMMGVAA